MTKFQSECVNRVKSMFLGIADAPNVDFREEHIRSTDFFNEIANLFRRILMLKTVPEKGKELPEISLVAEFEFRSHLLKFYVYTDEAEFHKDGDVIICEQIDYSSEEELIKDFISKVFKAISN